MTAVAQALSAALLHFIWQGTMVAFLLWLILSMLRNRTANARYLVSCAALALMAALPAITAWLLYQHPAVTAISTGTSAEIYAVRIARQSPPLAWIALWRQWTLPVWSLGVFVFALRLALSCRHVAALRRLGRAAEEQVAETVARLARHMKVRRAIGVLISTAAECPSVVGWLRPAILLPAATLAGLTAEQLQAVLAHEIAHIRRHDYLVNLAQTLVETLLFYHPAVWWVSARIRHERELCCDDSAVAMCGDAIFYARTLTSLERLRGAAPRLALGSAGGSLLYRVQRLTGLRQEIGPSKLPGILALALGLACFATTVHWAKAQQGMQQQPMPEEWGVSVAATGKVAHRERVPYPEATYKNGIQGTVMLETTLDQSGNVVDARVLSGPAELRKTALQSVLQWQFADAYGGEAQQVSITFQQDARARTQPQIRQDEIRRTESFLEDQLKAAREQGDSRATLELREKLSRAEEAKALSDNRDLQGQLSQEVNEAQLRRLKALAAEQNLKSAEQELKNLKLEEQSAQPNHASEEQRKNLLAELAALERDRVTLTAAIPEVVRLHAQIEELERVTEEASLVGANLARVEISGLPESARDELAGKITVHIGEVLSKESMAGAIAAVHQFDQRLECRFQRDANGDVVLRIGKP